MYFYNSIGVRERFVMKNPERMFISVDLDVKPELYPIALSRNISKEFPSVIEDEHDICQMGLG